MDLRVKVIYDELSKKDKIIADFFIKNSKDIISMSIHDVAASIGTSSASISRFVKKVYGKSFAQTKIEIAQSIEQDDIKSTSEILDWASDYEAMPYKIVSHIDSVCKGVINYNGIKVFENAITLINKAKTVYLYAVGSSGIVAQDLCQKLMKLKKTVIFVSDPHIGMISSMVASKDDVVIAISNGGKTKEVIIPVLKAKEKEAPIIAITSSLSSELYKNADIPIVFPKIESSSYRLGAIFSRYGELFIVDMLFIGLAKSLGEQPGSLLKDYHEILAKLQEGNK